jgi:hypothetical protein
MKMVMSTYPLLALPYFTQPFFLEYGASSEGIGEVLMQNQHSIAFKSSKLREHVNLYLICDKKMFSIMHALAKFI